MTELPFSIQKPQKINDLQIQCVEIGVCPNCHQKDLKVIGRFKEFKAHQCQNCFHIWII